MSVLVCHESHDPISWNQIRAGLGGVFRLHHRWKLKAADRSMKYAVNHIHFYTLLTKINKV